MSDPRLRAFTPARVGLGRCGVSLPTSDLLAFQLAHAQAQDAVWAPLDTAELVEQIASDDLSYLSLHSAAPDRAAYLRRPDWGRMLNEESRVKLGSAAKSFDVVFVIADGLSARAVQRHAVPLLRLLLPHLIADRWTIGPLAIVEQGRVAIGDEIGASFKAAISVVLIGERPGLSSPDSLGAYLTWNPHPGTTDADRNCVSNIRTGGLRYEFAVQKLLFLLNEARRRKLSGVSLKDDTPAILGWRTPASTLDSAASVSRRVDH